MIYGTDENICKHCGTEGIYEIFDNGDDCMHVIPFKNDSGKDRFEIKVVNVNHEISILDVNDDEFIEIAVTLTNIAKNLLEERYNVQTNHKET